MYEPARAQAFPSQGWKSTQLQLRELPPRLCALLWLQVQVEPYGEAGLKGHLTVSQEGYLPHV